MTAYDITILGAGPGGYVCAIRAAQLGLKAAVVEKQWLGGVCLNVGCIPSKALLKNAELAHTLRERSKEFGIGFDNLTLDYGAAVKRSRQVSDRLTKGVGFLMKKNNIDVIMGTGAISAPGEVKVTAADGSAQTLKTKNIVIASGVNTFVPPAWNVDGKRVITYLEAILQPELPKSVVIIGAGAIGLEFATVWSSYGTEVTLVEMLPAIAPTEDEEISAELTKAFSKRGITVLAGHKVESVQADEKGVTVKVSSADGEKTLRAEQALAAIGFRANTTGLGLEGIGVKLDQRGFVEVDGRMATNVPGVWAIGDVTGKLMLAHVASTMGIRCAEAIAGQNPPAIDYRMVPRATFCQPQVASFGYTEKQAREAGYEVKVAKFPFQGIGKAIALGDYAGFTKLVTDAKYGEILGAHLIGPEVSELLPELVLAHNNELTAEEVANSIHIHPTLAEALMEAAEAVEGKSINI